MTLLLNCDLGEWESPAETEALMAHIDLANIACGGHAGTVDSIRYCAQLARHHSVKRGMHPGLSGNKGRATTEPTAAEFKNLLEEQYTIFTQAIEEEPYHIKLHGSLYHMVETSRELCDAFLTFLASNEMKVLSLAGGRITQELGDRSLPEAFLDRGYLANGKLIPRGNDGDCITLPSLIQQRIKTLHASEQIEAYDGSLIDIRARALCIHSDTEGAAELAKIARLTINSV